MSTEPKKASDEQIALLRRYAKTCLGTVGFERSGSALTAVLDQLERQSAELEQYRKDWREDVIFALSNLERSRVWAGMDWHYNPLPPLYLKPAITRLRALLDATAPEQALAHQAQELGMYEVASAEQTGAHELTKSQAAYSAAAREATEKVCEWRRCNTATPAYESSCGEFFMGIGQLHCPKCQGRIVVVTGEIRASFPVRKKQ